MNRSPALSLALVALLTVPVAAQSTGTPVYQSPYRAFAGSEVGVTFSDPGPGFALEGSYRVGIGGSVDGGVRAGFMDGGHRTALLAGGDIRARVLNHSDAFPLDGALTVGLGVSSGDGYTVGYLPIGFTMARRVIVEGSSISLVPFIQPVLTPRFGDSDGTDLSLGFGLDARISPRLGIRFSAALGDRDGIAFTAAFLR